MVLCPSFRAVCGIEFYGWGFIIASQVSYSLHQPSVEVVQAKCNAPAENKEIIKKQVFINFLILIAGYEALLRASVRLS